MLILIKLLQWYLKVIKIVYKLGMITYTINTNIPVVGGSQGSRPAWPTQHTHHKKTVSKTQ